MAGQTPEREDYQAPYVLAMIICDAVHTDPITGKATILGCFTSIGAAQFPVFSLSMTVFAELTDGRGRVPITLQIVDVDEDQPAIFVGETEVDLSDPLVIGRLIIRIDGVTFPEPGEYRFQLFSDELPLIERRIFLMQI